MGISTHILDTTRGRPAQGVSVTLARLIQDEWRPIGAGQTDADGRVKHLHPEGEPLSPGRHQITFDVGDYFQAQNTEAFYPSVSIQFEVRDAEQHYHVPLLLNPFGYATYRGS